MNKLKLDLETVVVLSFPTTPESQAVPGALLAGVTISLCGHTCRGTSVCCETE